jgi:hypothetical protein
MRSSRIGTLPDVVAAPMIGSTAHGHASKATLDIRSALLIGAGAVST